MLQRLDNPVSKHFYLEQSTDSTIPVFAFVFDDVTQRLTSLVYLNTTITLISDDGAPSCLSFYGNMGTITPEELTHEKSLPVSERLTYHWAHMQPLIKLGYELKPHERIPFCDSYDNSKYFGILLMTKVEALRVLISKESWTIQSGRRFDLNQIPRF